jgi:hypothetical protein
MYYFVTKATNQNSNKQILEQKTPTVETEGDINQKQTLD